MFLYSNTLNLQQYNDSYSSNYKLSYINDCSYAIPDYELYQMNILCKS